MDNVKDFHCLNTKNVNKIVFNKINNLLRKLNGK